jgi:hypothetical protein
MKTSEKFRVQIVELFEQLDDIGFKIINLDCVIGRRGITIQLPPSSLAKLIILKPIVYSCGI